MLCRKCQAHIQHSKYVLPGTVHRADDTALSPGNTSLKQIIQIVNIPSLQDMKHDLSVDDLTEVWQG